MKGLELCRQYWLQVGLPAFEAQCPDLLDFCAAGLAGEGSECLGFDDELSRDHDWGPGFCLWYSEDTPPELAEAGKAVYSSLPKSFMGYERLRVSAYTEGRVGVMPLKPFLCGFMGLDHLPSTLLEWLMVPENGLAAATSGALFMDRRGEMTALRKSLEAYPRDVRLKKLAGHLVLAGQSGQYNYPRLRKRGDQTACGLALAEFAEHVQGAAFALAGKYKPYYKWAGRAMKQLDAPFPEIAGKLDLIWTAEDASPVIEEICGQLLSMLWDRGLLEPVSEDGFLPALAPALLGKIEDAGLRAMHILQF